MKKKLKLSKYKACICEGGAETAINAAYSAKIDVVNIVTSPEIEMLIICSEGKYEDYCKVKSKMSPSNFCKQYLPQLGYNKKLETLINTSIRRKSWLMQSSCIIKNTNLKANIHYRIY